MPRDSVISDYLARFAAQAPILGPKGQRRIGRAVVCLVGLGRLGSCIAQMLAAAGVGHLIGCDPQSYETDNFNAPALAMVPVVHGTPKARILELALAVRPHVDFEGLAVPIQQQEALDRAKDADLVVCAANTPGAHLESARLCVAEGIPLIDAALADGRSTLGGLVKLWLPEHRGWSACPACYLTRSIQRQGDGAILATAAGALASLAANMAVQILSRRHVSAVRANNLFAVDLVGYAIQSMAVEKRHGCRICAGRTA